MVAWFHIVFTGRNAAGTHNVLSYGLAYQLRATAYFLLMTETLPPISDQAPVAVEGAPKPKRAPAKKAAAKPRTAAKPKKKS